MDDNGYNSGRAKRQKIDKSGRSAALERLKSLKGSKNKCQVGEVENVYEYIDEKEYSKRVLQRQDEDWLENPGDGYIEDGREIFDDDYEDEEVLEKSKKSSKSKKKYEIEKSKNKSRNILQMVANMPGKKKKPEGECDILNLLDESLSTDGASNNSTKSEVLSSKEYLKRLSSNSSPRVISNENRNVKPQTQSKVNEIVTMDPVDHIMESELSQGVSKLENSKIFSQETEASQASENQSNVLDEDFTGSMDIDDFEDGDLKMPSTMDDFKNEVKQNGKVESKNEVTVDSAKIEVPSNSITMDLQEDFSAVAEELLKDGWDSVSQSENVVLQNVTIDKSDLPLTTNNKGEKVFRFFWWDAYEDPIKQPGVLYLFGKVYYEKKKLYVSCCVAVENIMRRVFLLPREKKLDLKSNTTTEANVTLLDVYQEFNDKIATPNKIMNFKSRKTTLKYAFDLPDVPLESEYLEIKYPSTYTKLAQDLSGETFSRVFGTNTTCLELVLLERKIKGPCWLEVKNPQVPNVQNSWCKIETRCSKMEDLSVSEIIAPPPPLVLMTVNIRSVVNNNMDNEIIMVGVLVQNQYKIDKPAPNPPFNSHFCTVTRSPNLFWPANSEEYLSKCRRTEVVVHQAEKSLLNHFLTKLFTIDPDVIIGHDLFGFTLDTLIQRIQRLKIPNWSRIGRLRRAIIPQFKGKQADKSVTCGRLVCDVVTSARELIRARSYDLTTLCKQVLGVEKTRQEFTSEEIKEKFEKNWTIQELINATMEDASYILKIIYEMNVLPLSLQITKIAGNVMSRTLLGGRSERNEFLLLHAFTEQNYLVPDKGYAKRPYVSEDGEDIDDGAKTGGKKKPQYAGGLVLEPKKGFYDKLILLMDFNSLYPSIIQEYNICFTTIARYDWMTAGEKDVHLM